MDRNGAKKKRCKDASPSNSESVRESVSACEIKKGFHSVLRKLWESARVVALLLAIQYAHRLISAVVAGDLFGRENERSRRPPERWLQVCR